MTDARLSAGSGSDSRTFYEAASREYLVDQAVGLSAALEESRQEIAALKHDLDRYIQIATDIANEPQTFLKWRHLKRGSIVTEVARGFAQVAHHPIEEMTAVVIYKHDADGVYWVRNAVEFDDGRFEPYPLSRPQSESGK